jgi:uncharacterized protein
MKVVLAGGSAALGRRIGDDLAGRGCDVVILTRRVDSRLSVRQVVWAGELEGRDTALINLAGKLVGCWRNPMR